MSGTSTTPLPTPRQLLTSLLTAISKIPPPPPPPQPNPATTTTDTTGARPTPITTRPTNPLKQIGPSHRPLFTTLHVLFPSLLLPALDLLDRGLVTRLALRQKQHQQHLTQDADGDTDMTTSADAAMAACLPSAVYLVRSAQKTKPTTRRGESAAGETASNVPRYLVHTAPWNCTCAAFAFAAFPLHDDRIIMSSSSSSSSRSRSSEKEDVDRWEFGGMSFDGVEDGDEGSSVPPCCKHLLACVLAERWAEGLGAYVNERAVSREEMAGIIADV